MFFFFAFLVRFVILSIWKLKWVECVCGWTKNWSGKEWKHLNVGKNQHQIKERNGNKNIQEWMRCIGGKCHANKMLCMSGWRKKKRNQIVAISYKGKPRQRQNNIKMRRKIKRITFAYRINELSLEWWMQNTFILMNYMKQKIESPNR